jgi:hypothetical protein
VEGREDVLEVVHVVEMAMQHRPLQVKLEGLVRQLKLRHHLKQLLKLQFRPLLQLSRLVVHLIEVALKEIHVLVLMWQL